MLSAFPTFTKLYYSIRARKTPSPVSGVFSRTTRSGKIVVPSQSNSGVQGGQKRDASCMGMSLGEVEEAGEVDEVDEVEEVKRPEKIKQTMKAKKAKKTKKGKNTKK